jgi:hypothetical protein
MPHLEARREVARLIEELVRAGQPPSLEKCQSRRALGRAAHSGLSERHALGWNRHREE